MSLRAVVRAAAIHQMYELCRPKYGVLFTWNERQIRALLVDYIDHYNKHRPHRALNQAAPNDSNVVAIDAGQPILRHARCGGLINEYRHAA